MPPTTDPTAAPTTLAGTVEQALTPQAGSLADSLCDRLGLTDEATREDARAILTHGVGFVAGVLTERLIPWLRGKAGGVRVTGDVSRDPPGVGVQATVG